MFVNSNNYLSSIFFKFFQLSLVFCLILVFFNVLNVIQQLSILDMSVNLVLNQLFLILLLLPVFYIGLIVLAQYFFIKDYFLAFFKWGLQVFLYIYGFIFLAFVFIFFNLNIFSLNFDQTYVSFGNGFCESVNSSFFTMFSLPLNFTFYIDILGILFMGLSFLLVFLCIFFLWPTFDLEKNVVLYISQLLLLLTQLQLTFTANNLLTFFVAFESLLIPMIVMISIWGSPNRRQANNYLVFYTMISAIPMLLAIIYIYHKYQTLNIMELITILSWTWTEQFFLWLAFFFAFAVKTPMVPVHIWLPKAHVDAPTVGSVILAGLLLKIGLIGFIRILLPLFPEATHFFAPYVSALATIGVIYSSFITLRQIDMKRIIAYSSVAHMNMAVVSLCSLNPIGIYSSIYLMLSHGLIASGLFFLVGFLYARFHVRTVSYFGGLATIMPVMTIIFFLFSLANMAFPFTSGFVGEFLLLLGITSTNFFLGFLNALSMLLTTVYTMLLFGRVFLGELKPKFQNLVEQLLYNPKNTITNNFLLQRFSIYDMYYYEFIITFILLFLIFWWGIYPQWLLSLLIKSSLLTYYITLVC